MQHGRGRRLAAAALVLLGVGMIAAAAVLVTRPTTARPNLASMTTREPRVAAVALPATASDSTAAAVSTPAPSVSAPPAISTPAPAATTAPASTTPPPASTALAPDYDKQMPNPVRLLVPAIAVSAPVIPLGLNPDKTIQVPKSFSQAGWFTEGPEPGERGAAVIVGHFDAKSGPGVFYRLRALRRGDIVTVALRGGSKVRFAVTRTLAVRKTRFPTNLVYQRTPRPTLRLVTCDGAFDSSTGHYVDNYIVFADLIDGT
jgi:LPXTG-site transpeptidase (sortase) family protein